MPSFQVQTSIPSVPSITVGTVLDDGDPFPSPAPVSMLHFRWSLSRDGEPFVPVGADFNFLPLDSNQTPGSIVKVRLEVLDRNPATATALFGCQDEDFCAATSGCFQRVSWSISYQRDRFRLAASFATVAALAHRDDTFVVIGCASRRARPVRTEAVGKLAPGGVRGGAAGHAGASGTGRFHGLLARVGAPPPWTGEATRVCWAPAGRPAAVLAPLGGCYATVTQMPPASVVEAGPKAERQSRKATANDSISAPVTWQWMVVSNVTDAGSIVPMAIDSDGATVPFPVVSAGRYLVYRTTDHRAGRVAGPAT